MTELEQRAKEAGENYRKDHLSTYNTRVQEHGKNDFAAGYLAGAQSVGGDGRLVDKLDKAFRIIEDFTGWDKTGLELKERQQHLNNITEAIKTINAYWHAVYIVDSTHSIPANLVDQLRGKNPYTRDDHWRKAYLVCCDTLQSLLSPSQPGSMEGEVTCVFCEMPCEPAPTKRGWSSVRSGKGLHFDCAGKVVDQGNAIGMEEDWDKITNHKFKSYDRKEDELDEMGNDPL